MPGQSVENVEIDRRHAAPSHVIDDIGGLLEGLDAIDRHLHVVIEILHADAGAGDAERCHPVVA